jgi:hypothetical protein
VPAGVKLIASKDVEMRRGEGHRHVALVASDADAAPVPHVHAAAQPANGFSLIRLSVPARLLIVAVASALLWAAVLWALR